MAEADVTSEVERYMALPGQACAYKVGELKILELREKAKTALGPKFNLKDFHAVVLENGGVPLTVLEQLVNEWIARAQHRREPRADALERGALKALTAATPGMVVKQPLRSRDLHS